MSDPLKSTDREQVLGVPADLDPDELERPLGTRKLGRAFQVWREVSSTNDLALRAATVRANEGLVVVADSQSAGRGQRGRTWSAPRGSSILMSVILHPDPPLDRPEALVTLTAIALVRTLSNVLSAPAQIKWPNDVYVEGRKLGGILVERNIGTVIGLGLNVHSAPPDNDECRATCVATHTTNPPRRSDLIRAILRSLDDVYYQALTHGLDDCVTEWKRSVLWLGESVRVLTSEEAIVGTLVDIDPTTGLTLRPGHGGVRFLPATSVSRLYHDQE